MKEITEKEFWFVVGPPPHSVTKLTDRLGDMITQYYDANKVLLGRVVSHNNVSGPCNHYWLVEGGA